VVAAPPEPFFPPEAVEPPSAALPPDPVVVPAVAPPVPLAPPELVLPPEPVLPPELAPPLPGWPVELDDEQPNSPTETTIDAQSKVNRRSEFECCTNSLLNIVPTNHYSLVYRARLSYGAWSIDAVCVFKRKATRMHNVRACQLPDDGPNVRRMVRLCPADTPSLIRRVALHTMDNLRGYLTRRKSLPTVCVAALLAGVSLAGTASAKPFEEYIKPTPTVAPLSSATWGVAGVIPRDISNGIESAMGAGVHPQWYYWDGEIIRAQDGKYHMFMSTFDANSNFGSAWTGSDAYHAISQTNVLGPYVRQDYVYANNGSHKGHNVSAAQLSDGSYVVVVSEIVPFQLYKSTSLDGPWTGCSPAPTSDVGASNISFIERHDGKFEITERNGGLAVADTLCGHYVRQQPKTTYTAHSNSVYPVRTSIPGVSNPTYAYEEDPHIWRSGGTYHIIYSGSGDRVGWHVYSPDGLTGWKDNGYAWSGRDYQKIFCYDGTTTCTAWYKMERPGVVLEDGHPTHITWAVSDVDKDNQVLPGTNHGTKVIVVPFDGVAFDTDFGTGGGDAGAGGAAGTGGTTGAGGGSGRDGATGMDGSPSGGAGGNVSGDAGRGGTTGAGGATAAGGSTSSNGGVSGGNGGAGGATSSGNAGGVSGSGGRASGGTTSSTGGASAGGHGGSSSTSTGAGSSSSGCSCTVQGRRRASGIGSLLMLGLVLLPLFRRRRSVKAR